MKNVQLSVSYQFKIVCLSCLYFLGPHFSLFPDGSKDKNQSNPNAFVLN